MAEEARLICIGLTSTELEEELTLLEKGKNMPRLKKIQ